MTRKPILVGGVGRCGTTVLKNAIAASPNVHSWKGELRWLSDPDGLGPTYETLMQAWSPFVADLALKRFRAVLVDTLKMHFVVHFGFKSTRPLDRMIKRISQHESMARYYGWRDMPTLETDPVVIEYELKGIITDFFDDLFDSTGIEEPLWIDDTPENVCFFDTFMRIWGGKNIACFHSIRHPLDIVASIKKRQALKDFSQIWWWPQEPRLIARRVRYIFDRWKHWQGEPGRVILLEELVEEPAVVMRRVCDDIGITYLPAMIEKISVERAHIGRWKDELTPTEVRECKLVVAPILKQFGYSTDT